MKRARRTLLLCKVTQVMDLVRLMLLMLLLLHKATQAMDLLLHKATQTTATATVALTVRMKPSTTC
jgi:hypothetical protein